VQEFDLTTVPFHPLLAAAYPVVFLFAVNAAEQMTFGPLWLPLALAVGATLATFGVMRVIGGSWRRAGLLTTILVIGFFGYGHAWNASAALLSSQWPLVVAWLMAIGVALALAWRARRHLVTITRVLNFVALFLVVVNVVGLLGAMRAFGAEEVGHGLTDLDLAPEGDALPNVYFVVPDRYGGVTALSETYGFDNEPFLTALEERGFAVARHAHANYIKTPLSLAATLNMEFLDPDALEAQAQDGGDRDPIHRVLRERLVVPASLKELGYRYVHIGNWWTPSGDNVDADQTFVYEGQDEFGTALAQTTLLRALGNPNEAPDDPWDWPVMRENNLYALDRLDETAEIPGPKYVFAHLVTTHPPYVHNADGSFTGRQQVEELGQIESYVRQLQYANSRLLGFVDRVLENDPGAIIVIAADEGPFPDRYQNAEWPFDWRTDASADELEEKFGILLAMRVPEADLEAEGFHDELTPINIFRIIFNARFGADLDLLPDRTWAHVDLDHFYDFFEITDELRSD
jgi:hypothetical protein